MRITDMLSGQWKASTVHSRVCGVAFALVLASVGLPAHALERWQEAGSGAAAILPQPAQAEGIVGASLSCAAQEWTLLLRTGADWRNQLRTSETTEASIAGTAELVIDQDRFAMPALRTNGSIALKLPHAALAPIRAGLNLAVDIGGEAGPASAQFALTGSRRVLAQVEPLCSPRKIDGYDLVVFSDDPTTVQTVRTLRADDIAAFKLATGATPRLQGAEMPLPEGKAVLFAQLCGSSWYFGRSGCNITAFLRAGASQAWRAAYENEGSTSYLELVSENDSWPGILAVPLEGKPDPVGWRWDGETYAPDSGLLAADADAVGPGSEVE